MSAVSRHGRVVEESGELTMRVGLVIGANQIGGAERQAWLLCRGLREVGIGVTVFSMTRPRWSSATRGLDFPVPVESLWYGRGREWFSRRRLAHLAEARGVEVLQLYNLEAMTLGASAVGSGGRVALAGSVRGILFSADEGVRGRLREACRSMVSVTCNCEATRNLLVESQVCPPEKIVVIPNAVEEAPASTAVAARSALSVLFVGSLKAVKAPLTFMRSALAVLNDHPEARFTVAGDGPLRAEMEAAARRESRSASFRFLGYVGSDQIPYDECNALVSTSIREASSNAILEALAHGLPVIATRVGGSIELMERSRGGVLIEPGDADALCATMRRLAESPEEAATMGERGRKYVLEHHRPQRTVQQHVELFRRVLDSSRA